eukprot:1066433-Pyramimonas_sp.AAC.1
MGVRGRRRLHDAKLMRTGSGQTPYATGGARGLICTHASARVSMFDCILWIGAEARTTTSPLSDSSER